MARIKYTALVESIRGSIQGTTFQRNAYGYTVKGKPNMVNPNTNAQSTSKRNMSGIAQAWSSLSDVNRTAWESWAVTNPVPSRLNPDANLTGFAQFTRWHSIRWLYNYGDILSNPAGNVGTVESYQVELINDNPLLQFAVQDIVYTEGPWVMLAFFSRPLKPTQKFVKSWTRFMGADTITGSSPAGFASLIMSSSYPAKFGALPPIGSQVAMRLMYQNTTNGQVITQASEVITVIA